MPNGLVIEGHTDSRPYRSAGPAAGYSNWELGATGPTLRAVC
jgi:flagellar motor protein MotB